MFIVSHNNSFVKRSLFSVIVGGFSIRHIIISNVAARRKGTRHVIDDNRSECQNEQIGIGMVAGTACIYFGGVRAHDQRDRVWRCKSHIGRDRKPCLGAGGTRVPACRIEIRMV